MIDNQTTAALQFYKLVRNFSLRTRAYEPAIRIFTTPSEKRDLTKASRRAYGRPDEVVAVMAAAGLDTLEEPMSERLITLPNEATLREFKRRTGFESQGSYREDFAPTWTE
jgi:hypothetical protein